MSEAATTKRRGFFSSFQYVTLIGGQMLALLVLVVLQNAMPKADLGIGAGASRSRSAGWPRSWSCGCGVPWKRPLSEEQVEAAKVPAAAGEARPGSMKLLFTKHWKPLLVCIGVTLGGTVAF